MHRGLAEDGREVAVKLLAPLAELDDPAARARFDREIRILAGMRHPHLVELLDHGVDDELGPYLVMPHLSGSTLRELFAGVHACPEAVLLLLQPIVSALGALHGAGLVHRDLKPENIMVAGDGQVKLVDLGFAYGQGYTRYTDEGSVVGSVPYMSPEQVEGGAIDTSCDIWAVGVMAYEWLTGTRPFARARPAEEAAALLVGAFAPLAAVDRRSPAALSELVSLCLARDRTARPSADELHQRLHALIDWTDGDAARVELAAATADVAAYQARVAPVRVSILKRAAERAMVLGDSFAALGLIDRALAYAPQDPQLSAMCERAESAEASPARGAAAAPAVALAPGSAPGRSRKRLAVGALVAVALVAALGVVTITQHRSEETAAEREQRENEAALRLFGDVMQTVGREMQRPGVQATVEGDPAEARAALELVGGALDLYQRGLDRKEKVEARPADGLLDAGGPAVGPAASGAALDAGADARGAPPPLVPPLD